MAEGRPRYSPKTTLSVVSSTTTPIAVSPQPASVALGLIATTRIGSGVDFPAKLATGVTVGRANYHPGLQRFISEDPIGFEGGDVNVYAYVHNSPVQYRDPSGWWGVGGVVGGNAEVGLPVFPGAAASLLYGWGLFGGGCHGVRDEAFISVGGFATPTTIGEKIALGAYAGYGGGFFFTNATNVAQIGGPGDTWSLDVSAGPVPIKGSLSISFSGGGFWTFTATGGWGLGAGVSRTPTTTGHAPVPECPRRSKSSQ